MDERMLRLAAAYVRGALDEAVGTDTELLEKGQRAGLPMFRFKRAGLPRVNRVISLLEGLRWSVQAHELLDVGSGRGAFLYELLAADQAWAVTSIDVNNHVVHDNQRLVRGGVLHASLAQDIRETSFLDSSFDVVVALEVLEHLPDPSRAVQEMMRISRGFCVISVPSRKDDNPQHLHLLRQAELEDMFSRAGAKSMKSQYVRDHLIMVINVEV